MNPREFHWETELRVRARTYGGVRYTPLTEDDAEELYDLLTEAEARDREKRHGGDAGRRAAGQDRG